MFWRSPLSELEPVRRALAQGRYDAAFALLESAARRPRGRQARAIYRLHLAAVYALYGDDGLESGLLALRAAVETDPSVVEHPLYQALFWEFGALRGDSAREVKRGVKKLRGSDDVAAVYHAASALFTAGAYKSAVAYLRELDPATLPAYLLWRRWSLEGMAQEQLGHFAEAAEAFAASVEASGGGDQQLERLSLANCLLELHRPQEVLAVLEQIEPELLENPDDHVQRHYLAGRAEAELGNPNRALERLREARTLAEGDSEGETYSLWLSEGQILASLGMAPAAASAFAAAVAVAPDDQRAYALHEWGLALIEANELEEAQEGLEEIVADLTYPYRADAMADLADVYLKLGLLDRAERAARGALDLGSTGPACLCLGAIAYEYYRLDEAATWFERAVSAGEPGEPVWITAHQQLADVFAQQGADAAERLFTHASAALSYTDPSNEWYLPLRRYLEIAQRQLGGHSRRLN